VCGPVAGQKGDKPYLRETANRAVATRLSDRLRENLNRPAPLACAELNSLRQRKLSRKVDRVRLAAHVALPAIASALAPAAGILFPAERAANLRTASAGVYVRDTAIASDCAYKFLRFAHVVGENRGRQSLRHVVLDCDRFVELPIRQQVK
jgi:hypothetical protein